MALFGTDGIRGSYGDFLTAELAERVAFAAGQLIPPRSRVIVGRDPRQSGVELEAGIISGFTKCGHDVARIGVIPTPGLAFLACETGIALGVMITASHNPATDNGIKIFGHDGMKISDLDEDRIEKWVNSDAQVAQSISGALNDDNSAVERYVNHLKSSIDSRLSGLKVVVDCAHGAASVIAPRVLRELGAEVSVIGARPDGLNINSGVGSTHLELLQETVQKERADIGIAHDGDADRTLMVDARGRVIDGDAILAALAISMSNANQLEKNTVVTTVMSNLGFHKKMAAVGIAVEVTSVGDRYVLERINEKKLSLGGEQSGHIIIRRLATTGDGILTALSILALMAKKEFTSESLYEVFPKYPQILVNIPVTDKSLALADPRVLSAIAAQERSLGENGRVLVRASGTENLVRVMAEADTIERAEEVVESISSVLKMHFGA